MIERTNGVPSSYQTGAARAYNIVGPGGVLVRASVVGWVLTDGEALAIRSRLPEWAKRDARILRERLDCPVERLPTLP